MTTHKPNIFDLNNGIDLFNPDVVRDQLQFLTLDNIEPRRNRLFASKGNTFYQNLGLVGDRIVSFGFYQLSNRQFANLYAFSKTKIFWFDFSTGLFDPTPIYSSFNSSLDPYVILPWYDALYVTKPYGPFLRLQRKQVTQIASAPFGRYGAVVNSHIYLAGVGDSISNELSRIWWSDLDAPESFDIDPNSSEADFFDLEPDSREITGVSYQRGSPIVYSQDCIWVGSYVGFPGGFRHEPLYPGVGAIFHNCVVRAGDIDFFIGKDNIYRLNGLQLDPIGDQIWDRFIADVNFTSDTSVRGYLNTRGQQVFWIYESTSRGNALWTIVYNYKDGKWSERDPNTLMGFLDSPRTALRGYDSIDSVATMIDSTATLVDDPNSGYPLVLPQFGSTLDGVNNVIARFNVNVLKYDSGGLQYSYVMETADFVWDDFNAVKEFTKVALDYKGVGTPNLQCFVASRHNPSEALVYSGAIAQVNTGDGTPAFYIRTQGVGKYLRLKFTWNNTNANSITELRLLSITKVENLPDNVATEK